MMAQRLPCRIALLAIALLLSACGDGTAPDDKPDVTLSAGATSIELVPGSSNFIVFSVQRSGGYAGTVDLATTNVPQGITAVFDPPQVVAGALVSSLRIAVAPLTSPGSYTIMTRASGAGVEATSVPVTIIVTVPSITLSIGSSSVALEQGKSTTIPITVTRSAGYTGTVGLSALALPTGVTATITPVALVGNATTAALTLNAALQATLGAKEIMIRGDADGASDKSVPVQLTVTANTTPAVLLLVQPVSVEIIRGQSASVTVTAERLAGYNGDIAITVDGLPANVTAIAAPIIAGSNSTQLTFNVGLDAPVAIHTVSIRAEGTGISSATTAFSLRVLELPGFRFSFPSGPNAPGGTNLVTVGALPGQPRPVSGTLVRFSGFSESVTITAIELPAGWTTTGLPLTLGPTQTQVAFSFTIPAGTPGGSSGFRIRGVATNGLTVEAVVNVTINSPL